MQMLTIPSSSTIIRTPCPSERRAILHRSPRKNAPKHRGEHKCESEVVEHVPNGSPDRRRYLPSLVAEEILRGGQEQFPALWRAKPVAD